MAVIKPPHTWEQLKSCYEEDASLWVGVDEVGRGPLAGPVVAAAVVMCPKQIGFLLKDSKKLTAKKREHLSKVIWEKALAVCVVEVDHKKIDEINILQATLLAMSKAVLGVVSKLDFTPKALLIDGNKTIFELSQFSQYALVGGDNCCPSIMAASIVAKVHRDALMNEFDLEYPGYGFSSHKGYGTKKHVEAIFKLGPSAIHRQTFEPIKSYVAKNKTSS